MEIDQDEPVEVKPELLQDLERISKEAKVELSSKCFLMRGTKFSL